jgi:hypothetical protein
VSIGDEGVVLPPVLSFAQAGLSQGPQPKSQSPLLKRTSVSPVSNLWVSLIRPDEALADASQTSHRAPSPEDRHPEFGRDAGATIRTRCVTLLASQV